MRLIIFSSSFLPVKGGVQEVVYRVSKEFIRKNQEVLVVTQRHPRSLKRSETVDGIPVRRIQFPNLIPNRSYLYLKYLLGIFFSPIGFLQLFFLIKNFRPDVVYLHFVGMGAFYLLLCKKLLRFKLVCTFHGDDIEGLPTRHTFHKWLLREICNNADYFTACSEALLRKAIEFCPSISDKCQSIHNGVDLCEFKNIIKFSHQRPYIFAGGRFVEKKGFDVLIHAYHLIAKKSKIDLILAGDGPQKDEYMNLIKKNNLNLVQKNGLKQEHGVILWGWASRKEMISLLSGSELFVVPSRQEPFGIVVLEGMAAGVPVVATKVGGIPEIAQGASAILVPPDNEKALAEAIELVLAKEDLRKSLVTQGKRRINDFNWHDIADRYLELASL